MPMLRKDGGLDPLEHVPYRTLSLQAAALSRNQAEQCPHTEGSFWNLVNVMASPRRGGRRARCPPNPPAAPAPAAPAFTFGAPAPAAVVPTPMFGVAPPAAPAPAAPAFTFGATAPAATFAAAPTVFGATSAVSSGSVRAPATVAPAPADQGFNHNFHEFTSGALRQRYDKEIHALRRLVCGSWIAQWRMLCELGEDPAAGASHFGGSRVSFQRGVSMPSRDPAAMADRFVADLRRWMALDASGIRWSFSPDAEPAQYAAALAEKLLLMERASGCLRALAAIEVAPRTPAQLREQLDAASEPPEPLEQARVMLANLDPSALAQSDLDTMQRDLATMKQTLEAASERVQREVVRRELAALSGFRSAEEETCVICMDRSPNVTLVPCGHRITCQQCAERLTECPTCRSPITLRQRTFG